MVWRQWYSSHILASPIPDLNPIEFIWQYFKCQIYQYETPLERVQELWNQVSEKWNVNSPKTCQNLIQDIAREIQAVLRAKGSHTEYQIAKLYMLKKMSQWLIILFGSLLNQFWSKSCDSGLVRKPICYSFLHKQAMLPDYVRRSHQSDLSKTSKHWDIFLSHCNCRINHERMRIIEPSNKSKYELCLFSIFQIQLWASLDTVGTANEEDDTPLVHIEALNGNIRKNPNCWFTVIS